MRNLLAGSAKLVADSDELSFVSLIGHTETENSFKIATVGLEGFDISYRALIQVTFSG